jgi:hypothetical protein
VSAERRLRKALERATASLSQPAPNPERAKVAVDEALRAAAELVEERSRRCERPLEEWCVALRAQATTDLSALEALLIADVAEQGRPWATIAMLFQMVFEKITKAMLARTDAKAFEACLGSHASISRFFKAIENQGKYNGLKYRWPRHRVVLLGLERAHPALAKGGPQLEYPWETREKVWLPAESGIVSLLSDPRSGLAAKLLRFANELLRSFEEVFAR